VPRSAPHRFAQAFAAFALLALLARALVAPGYMLAPAQGGGVLSITLCSGYGPAAVSIDLGAEADAIDAQHNGKVPADAPEDDGPCVFAAMAAMSAPIAPPAITAPPQTGPVSGARAFHLAPGRGLAAPPPWSTGPPLTL